MLHCLNHMTNIIKEGKAISIFHKVLGVRTFNRSIKL